jgi:hypothetical protein
MPLCFCIAFLIAMTDKLFTIYLPGSIALVYAMTGIYYLTKKNYPWFLIWISYATANIGLVLAAIKK